MQLYTMKNYRSPLNNGEWVTTLPVRTNLELPDGSVDIVKRVVYSRAIEDVQVGDVIEVMGCGEFTNDLGYIVSVVHGLILCNSSADVDGIELDEAGGSNVSRDVQHHDRRTFVGAIELTPDIYSGIANKRVNLWAAAVSSAAQPGHNITVGQDYGFIFVKKSRPYTP